MVKYHARSPRVLSEDTAYFCAQWRRQKITELQKDYVILDGVEGRGPVAEIT